MNMTFEDSARGLRQRCCIPIAWLVLIVFDLCLVALACAQTDPSDRSIQADPVVVTQIDGPNDVGDDDDRFEAIDVFVDSGDMPLAAYQFELQSETPGVEIVGIEGGEHAAFQEPPYYDVRAIQNNRVILAAFSTADDLPSGRSRVARIQVLLTGPGIKEYRTLLKVSASKDGEQVPAEISIARTRA